MTARFPWLKAAYLAVGAGALSLVGACTTSTSAEKAPAPVAETAPAPVPAETAAKPAYGTFGFDSAGMDPSVAPGDNFYRYANGKWDDTTEIPPDRSSYAVFTRLAEEADRRNRELIENAAKTEAPEGSELRKLADYFTTFMDEAAIEAKGIAPLKADFERIAPISNVAQLSLALGDTLRADVDALNTGDVSTSNLFGLWVAEDFNDPTRYAPYLLQGGLGLPDREYYLGDDPKLVETRQKYEQHIAAMLKLAGIADPEAKAKRIVALETKLAKVHWNQVDTQDVAKTNNPWKRADFAKKAPGMVWERFFTAAGLGEQQDFIVWQPSALIGISKLVASEPLATWKDYLTFHAISDAAPYLPKAFVEENFAFYGRTLFGSKQLRERWKRGVSSLNAAMGEAVGKLYVEKYFPAETKAEAEEMVKNIVAAFGDRIDGLTWMSEQTKARAREKLGTLQVGIGHPEKFRDYSALQVVRGDALGNAHRASLFELERNLKKLGQPVDKQEWFMVPHLVNALNSPQQNSIIFPAAILQPPFFDPNADPAVNYGGIGSVIGHEIIHSFDDLGAQFDANGKLANWWQPEDAAKFKAAGQALVEQYNEYEPLPGMHVNGELTLGENIADVAGLAIAYDGWKRSLGGEAPALLDGFSGDQRFFLGYAQAWRGKMREATLRNRLLTDGHAPYEARTSAVRNHDAWYPAFKVVEGQQLHLTPDERVRIW